jgi:hypothetical protein
MPTFMGDEVDEMYAKLCREFAKARGKDLRRRSSDEEDAEHAEYGIEAPEESEQRKVALRWVKRLRERFTGFIVRRTHDSVDCDGKKISGLAPYEEYRLDLRQFKLEASMIKSLPSRNSEDAKGAKSGHQGVCGHFRFLIMTKDSIKACPIASKPPPPPARRHLANGNRTFILCTDSSAHTFPSRAASSRNGLRA